MPLSITATYNSINKDTAFGNGPASGYGWQFSFNQYVREVTDKNLTKAGYNYIYTDADGTDHYLKLVEGETAKWEDEDGLGITLTKDENNIFIDNGSTTQTYESTADGGKLLVGGYMAQWLEQNGPGFTRPSRPAVNDNVRRARKELLLR